MDADEMGECEVMDEGESKSEERLRGGSELD